jgi:hypothetical protein
VTGFTGAPYVAPTPYPSSVQFVPAATQCGTPPCSYTVSGRAFAQKVARQQAGAVASDDGLLLATESAVQSLRRPVLLNFLSCSLATLQPNPTTPNKPKQWTTVCPNGSNVTKYTAQPTVTIGPGQNIVPLNNGTNMKWVIGWGSVAFGYRQG